MNAHRNNAARTIVACRRRGLKILALPLPQCPKSLDEAYRLQQVVSEIHGIPRVGWKVACTNAASQASYPIGHPVAGPIHRDSVLSYSDARTKRFVAPAIEAEIVFGFRHGFNPREVVTLERVRNAVEWVAGGIEIVDTMFPNKKRAGVPTVIAGGHAAGVVIGKRIPVSSFTDLASEAVEVRFDQCIVASGSSTDVLGDPWRSLQWLILHLKEVGLPIRAGEVVFTGSCTPLKILPGNVGHVTASFSSLGSVELAVRQTEIKVSKIS